MDRPARVPLRVVPRLPHNLRVAHTTGTTRIIRTRCDMLRVAMDPIMDLEMALDMAIIMLMVRNTGVGLVEYLFRAVYPNSSEDVQSLSRCGFSKWSIISPSQAFRRGSL